MSDDLRDLRARLQREQLHHAASSGDLARVKDLLKRNYPVNRFDEIGKTPLHYAAQSGRIDIVECLIDAGADPTIPGWMGLTAIDHAKDRNDIDASKVRVLLKNAVKAKRGK